MNSFKRKYLIVSVLIFSSTILWGQAYSDSISVNFFLLDECMICQKMSPHFEEIYTTYKDDFHIIAYFPNFSSKPDNIENFKLGFNLSIPHKTDYYKRKSTSLGATVLPQVVVKDEVSGVILYSGRINDMFTAIGKQRRHIKNHDLKTALNSILLNEEIQHSNTEAIGCFINFKEF